MHKAQFKMDGLPIRLGELNPNSYNITYMDYGNSVAENGCEVYVVYVFIDLHINNNERCNIVTWLCLD